MQNREQFKRAIEVRILLSTLMILMMTGCAAHRELTPSATEQETVVLIHGLGRSAVSMWLMEVRIEKAGYDVVAVDYPSLGTTPDEVIDTVSAQIDACCRDKSKVHFVGHSLGGLLIRAYFSETDPAAMSNRTGQVVMIGTPNAGSAMVDYFRDSWWMPLLGETTLSLGTTANSLPGQLPPPPFKAGIIAGSNGMWLSDAIFEEANDGLVTVASTRLPNMADFIEIDVSHSMMRYDHEVAEQTIAFLKTGRFHH